MAAEGSQYAESKTVSAGKGGGPSIFEGQQTQPSDDAVTPPAPTGNEGSLGERLSPLATPSNTRTRF